ncbi:hypothetical protein Slala02_59530 [Streptomyces lavendulae subsp. lavendulae]|nr:hypothetical protein Slala01_62940 [Streptomyces lavendulae subsp. lavendulae]GLX30133.1 hypothetical protein Slala02_59530 [Streptomyces lavendulae subsp. lavendulae]
MGAQATVRDRLALQLAPQHALQRALQLAFQIALQPAPRLRPRQGILHVRATVKGVGTRRLLLYETPKGTEDISEEPQANDRKGKPARREEEARRKGRGAANRESRDGPTTPSETNKPKSARAEGKNSRSRQRQTRPRWNTKHGDRQGGQKRETQGP